MIKMLNFELKKVFSKSRNKIVILLMVVITIITSILTINRVEYVDENGNHSVGFTAAKNLRDARNEWAGYLTDDVLKKVIAENRRINNSDEAQSDDIAKQNQAFSEKQGILGILDVINFAWSDYRDYNFFAADSVSEDDVNKLYEKRISTLKNWLDSGKEYYTQKEKDFLIQRYEALDTPFYYEYTDGWAALLQNISTFILMLALMIGFLVSGIFSDEFQTKADSIFFSAKMGRNKAIVSKVGAGFLITSVFYIVFVLLYTLTIICVLGADGAGCPLQLDMWRSVYNITFFKAYLFYLLRKKLGVFLLYNGHGRSEHLELITNGYACSHITVINGNYYHIFSYSAGGRFSGAAVAGGVCSGVPSFAPGVSGF